MKRILLFILTVLFFAALTVLTFTARSIHQSMIPNVTAKRLTKEDFGGYERRLAVPVTLPENGDVYVVTTRIVNGEKRDFARKITLSLGDEADGLYEVTGGVSERDLVIFTSDKTLNDGDEVFVVK